MYSGSIPLIPISSIETSALDIPQACGTPDIVCSYITDESGGGSFNGDYGSVINFPDPVMLEVLSYMVTFQEG